jgi:hypothetical protein
MTFSCDDLFFTKAIAPTFYFMPVALKTFAVLEGQALRSLSAILTAT